MGISWTRALRRLYPHLKRRLSPARYRHSQLVAQRAAVLAHIHGADSVRAFAAGLTHDICHGDSPERQLKYLRAHDILLDNLTMAHPQIWHARTAVPLLWELGLRDKAVLEAVRYHTTGRAGMTLLEKVVYLADVTSPDRSFPGVHELRALSDRDLNVAMRTCLWHTINELVEKREPIVEDCWAAYNDFI